jgi:hypothetical protein
VKCRDSVLMRFLRAWIDAAQCCGCSLMSARCGGSEKEEQVEGHRSVQPSYIMRFICRISIMEMRWAHGLLGECVPVRLYVAGGRIEMTL